MMAITINGKRRGEIKVKINNKENEILETAKAEVSKWIENKAIIKEIIVPNKLINFVVK